MKEVAISSEPIELCKLLKLGGVVACGADAKTEIAAGNVLVNGAVEKQKRKKILAGDVVEFERSKFKVVLE